MLYVFEKIFEEKKLMKKKVPKTFFLFEKFFHWSLVVFLVGRKKFILHHHMPSHLDLSI